MVMHPRSPEIDADPAGDHDGVMAQHPKEPYWTGGYEQQRRELLDSPAGQFCVHCGEPATEADHQPPLSLHRHISGTGCCQLVPSCFKCGREQGGQLWNATQMAMYEQVIVEPEGFPVDHAVWNVPWLDSLRDVPPDATWPRFMTVPHPRAVGSLGPVVEAWCRARRGKGWRWWQRLVAYRLLEIDAAGRLVWETMILTLARQLGKTWWLHDICNWRFESAVHFGEPQVVLSTGKDVEVVFEMRRPARVAAKVCGWPYKPREVNGQAGIDKLDDESRWLVRSQQGVYGNSCSMATVDEGWKVPASTVEDGVVPTMVERDQSQLLLISTAHRRATALMIGRRATALEQLGSPEDDSALLIEWSAPRGAELDDHDGWRQASPFWTPKRERWIAQRLAAARSGESTDADEPDPIESFRSQWLNQWPAKRLALVKGDPIIEPGEWEAAFTDANTVGPLVIGIEDHHGHGAAVAFVGTLPDGRWVIGGELYASRAEAYAIAAHAATDRPGSLLVVGASLASDVELLLMPGLPAARKSGIAETAASLSNLRDLIATGRALQDGSPELTSQLHQARATTGQAGLALIPRTRSDLLRAAVWALRVASTTPALEPAIR
jgi:hypothetical protein